MSEVQATVEYLKESLYRHRLAIFWTIAAALFLWLLIEVREVTSLLLLSYGIALLLDPLVTTLDKKGVPRSISIVGIAGIFLALAIGLLVIGVPLIIREYQTLLLHLPDHLRSAGERTSTILKEWFGITYYLDVDNMIERTRKLVAAISVEQLRNLSVTVGSTLLSGYSFALTIFNIFLLPFFVFYIARDLHLIHSFLSGFLARDVRTQVQFVGRQVLKHVYAFFKGQCTVALALVVLYVIGLSIAGLPSSFLVGTIAGLLSVVPYLGVATGALLATIITLLSDPTWTQFLKVWAVFAVVQAIEGTVLTPKIVGESVGIHPFGVMLALIVGGKLFGLVGLILAIPAAASVRVLFRYLVNLLDDELDPEDAASVYRETPAEPA